MLATYNANAVAEVLGLHDAANLRQDTPRGEVTAQGWSVGFREDRVPITDDPTVSMTAVSMEAAVEGGLPRSALRHVAEWLADGDAAKVGALEWAVVPKTTLERRTGKLSVPESERTERIARLTVQARQTFGTDDEARTFMTAPHPELDGRTPVEAARTDLGARRAERILLALEYGLAL